MYNTYNDEARFSELLGKTLEYVKVNPKEIFFICSDGDVYLMKHIQDCCEDVTIDDISGNFKELIGQPILLAEEVTSNENPKGVPEDDYEPESFTWTFYKLATNLGYVTMRWYGESNGYYSERVDFIRLNEREA